MSASVDTGLNPFKQLHTLLVLHFNRCLTTEYSETTTHFNGNFDTDNQIYVPWPKCTATFRTHCICMYLIVYYLFIYKLFLYNRPFDAMFIRPPDTDVTSTAVKM
jgi:hypothetical protein